MGRPRGAWGSRSRVCRETAMGWGIDPSGPGATCCSASIGTIRGSRSTSPRTARRSRTTSTRRARSRTSSGSSTSGVTSRPCAGAIEAGVGVRRVLRLVPAGQLRVGGGVCTSGSGWCTWTSGPSAGSRSAAHPGLGACPQHGRPRLMGDRLAPRRSPRRSHGGRPAVRPLTAGGWCEFDWRSWRGRSRGNGMRRLRYIAYLLCSWSWRGRAAATAARRPAPTGGQTSGAANEEPNTGTVNVLNAMEPEEADASRPSGTSRSPERRLPAEFEASATSSSTPRSGPRAARWTSSCCRSRGRSPGPTSPTERVSLEDMGSTSPSSSRRSASPSWPSVRSTGSTTASRPTST